MAPRFDEGAWAERLGGIRDVVRQRLVTSQLIAHLPHPSIGQLIVDVGCGQASQVIALAERGYEVVGVDPSERLLALARRTLADHPVEIRSRVTLAKGDVETLADVVPALVDVMLCHGVLMYLPSLDDSIATLAGRLARGGVLSLLTRNQAGIAMRAGMEGRWQDAIDGFGARRYTNNLGIDDVRADDPDEVMAACEAQGLEVMAWYGVRLFTDHRHAPERSDDLDSMIEAERVAGERDPYRRVAALTHVLARRPD